MALTTELLNANSATATLTDEQKNAIVEMSNNDENSVIGAKVGEIYRNLDADVLATSGIAKDGAEKTYDYAKRVIGGLKEKADAADGNAAKIATLEKEKARLEKTIQEGGQDAEVKKELTKAKADLSNVQREYAELKTKFDKAESDHAAALLEVRIAGEFAGITPNFKKDLPEGVKSVLLNQAIATVKGMSPEYIDNGAGGKVLAFMKDGVVLRNAEKNLAPFTAADLVLKELKGMGVLEEGRKQTGTGSQSTLPGVSSDGSVDISGAKTQVEADDLIKASLLARGLAVGTVSYQKEFDKIRVEKYDAIKTLPLK